MRIRPLTVITLLVCAAVVPAEAQIGSALQTAPPNGVVVFTQDAGTPPMKSAWVVAPPVPSTTPSGRAFIGPMGLRDDGSVDTAVLWLTSLIPHDRVVVSFNLLVNGSVDGHGSAIPEWFTVKVDGQDVFAHTFSNITLARYGFESRQTYNPLGQSGQFPPQSGAHEVDTLGYFGDAVYRVTLTVPHDKSTVNVVWRMALNEGLANENWGLDDVEVRVVPRGLLGSASGLNGFGQLGDGSTQHRGAYLPVAGLSDVIQLQGGEKHSLALLRDGTVWSWGSNPDGQLGTGTGSSFVPTLVAGLGGDVVQIAANASFSLALKKDGSVWGWGINEGGQVGDGSTASRATPVRVQGLPPNIVAISAGWNHSVALDREGNAWQWGWAVNYRRTSPFGSSFADFYEATPVPRGVAQPPKFVAISAGGYDALGVAADGSVWSWGHAHFYELGSALPTQPAQSGRPVKIAGLSGIRAVSAGIDHHTATTWDGQTWAWGDNRSAQFGNGTTANATPIPTKTLAVNLLGPVTSYQSLSMTSSGELVMWGNHPWHAFLTTPTIATPVVRPLEVGRGLHHSFILHPPAIDADSDGVLDFDDNCDGDANAGQGDWDKNGVGDACDPGTQAPPSIISKLPVDGWIYRQGEAAAASYWCIGQSSPIVSCVGDIANGALLNTTGVGARSFKVIATDAIGHITVHEVNYEVGPALTEMPSYTVESVVVPGASGQATALDVNSSKVVVGFVQQDDGGFHFGEVNRAFVSRDGVVTTLVFPGAAEDAYSVAHAVNERGDVVGASQTAAGALHAFLFRDGELIDLNSWLPPGGPWVLQEATAINDVGDITGVGLIGGKRHAFRHRAAFGNIIDLGVLPGGTFSYATSINNAGEAVGYATISEDPNNGANNVYRATVATGLGQFANLGILGGFTDSQALGNNDRGSIVGNSYSGHGASSQPFVHRGAMNAMPALAGFPVARAAGINSSEQIVGSAHDPANARFTAFVSDPIHATRDLHGLVPVLDGWRFIEPTAISDAGHIVGRGNQGVFLLTPSSVPLDSTPPLVVPSIVGTLSPSGWYTTDVLVTWSVSDPESPFTTTGCAQGAVISDVAETVFECSAASHGGVTDQSVTVRRDATPPTITSALDGVTLERNRVATAVWTCADALSGIVACEGNVAHGAPVDTSTVGEFSFTIAAADAAGNQAERVVRYFVAPPTNTFVWAKQVDQTPQPSARFGHAMVYDRARQKLILIGGRQPDGTYLNDVWERDSLSGEWQEIAPATAVRPVGRLNFGAAFHEGRRVVVIYAGQVSSLNSNVNSIGDTWEWSPDTRTWQRVAVDPIVTAGFLEPSLAWDPAGHRVIMFGGRPYYGTPINSTTYAFTGSGWTPITSQGPEGRAGAAMSTDVRRNRVVLHGGWNRNSSGQWWQLADTWEWDGVAWLRMDSPGGAAPQARTQPALVYDESRSVTVLFGGSLMGPFFTAFANDTWEWNGREWRHRPTIGAPSARLTSMAYDPVAQRLLLFGGNKDGSNGHNLQQPGGAFGDVHVGGGFETVPVALEVSADPIAFGAAATLIARVSAALPLGNQTVQFDLNRDGIADASAAIDAGGNAQVIIPAPQVQALLGGMPGTFTFDAFVAAQGLHASAHASAALVIRKHLPTIVVAGGTFTYDGQPHVGPVSLTGLGGIDLGAANLTLRFFPDGPPVNGGTYEVTATFAGNDEYESASATGVVIIEPVTPTVTWSPAPLSYRSQLGHEQMNAVASVPGTFSYQWGVNPRVPIGANPLVVTFMPFDARNYTRVVTTSLVTSFDDVAPDLSPTTGPTPVEAVSPAGVPVQWEIPVAIDEVDGPVPVICTPGWGSWFPIGVTAVQCSASDASGNTANRSFTVTVFDVTAPVIVEPIDRDAVFAASPARVSFSLRDAVGVTEAWVNGIRASLTSGSSREGVWVADVPVTLPIAYGNALQFTVTASDGAGNALAPVPMLVDNDGIASAIDREGAVNLPTQHSNGFVNGQTMGWVARQGWTVKVNPLGTSSVLASIEGAGASAARISVGDGDPRLPAKDVLLDRPLERAALTLSGSTITVTAAVAFPSIQIFKRITELRYERRCYWTGSWPNQFQVCENVPYYYTYAYSIDVPQGQTVSTGSPVSAALSNTEPITVNLVELREDGTEIVVGSFMLDAGEVADVEVTPGTDGADDIVGVSVISGTVEVTIGGETQVVAEGQTSTLLNDTMAPVIAAPNLTVGATSAAGAVVNYDAVVVTDNADATPTVVFAPPSGSVLPIGVTTVTVTAMDAAGNPARASFTVTVTGDTAAPVIGSVTPSRTSLWPANHDMVPVQVAVSVSDLVDTAPVCRVESITSSEPDHGLGDGDTAGDTRITGPLSVNLRAERSGLGEGRVYTIQVACEDWGGNISRRAASVSVPRSHAKGQ